MSIIFDDYDPSEKEEENNDLTIGIFFDGTNNNKNNTKAKEYYDKRARGKKLTSEETVSAQAYRQNGRDNKGSSYHNDWSNVARLYDIYPDKLAVYVDGIGTETEKGDSILGAGFGTGFLFGGTGILGKVEEGCEKLALVVASQSKKKEIPILYLDVFGFSRGAAAARVFLDEISKKPYPLSINLKNKGGYLGYYLAEKEIKVGLVKVRFLGLFDTVSSYSASFSPTPDFDNDTTELSLNNLSKAETVMHFTAADEHRKNFSLTKTKVGKEREFPGVHSDVGGSYNDGVEVVKIIEKNFKENLTKLSTKLVNSSWYTDEQLEISFFGPKHELKGIRKLKKTYSYIPLHFMAEYGVQKTVPLTIKKLTDETYSISEDPLLIRVKDRLRSYAMENGKQYTFKRYKEVENAYGGASIPEQKYADYQAEMKEQDDLRILRNKYLHWSARREGIGMDPTPDRVRVLH